MRLKQSHLQWYIPRVDLCSGHVYFPFVAIRNIGTVKNVQPKVAAEKSISFVVLWNNAQLPDVILKSQEINVMWPIFCPVTVGLGLLTREVRTRPLFSQ